MLNPKTQKKKTNRKLKTYKNLNNHNLKSLKHEKFKKKP